MERIEYDEFGLFHENAQEFGLPYDAPPVVRRVAVEVEPGRRISSLVWGESDPELVLIHGGSQNAHTWDTVAMALGKPLLAIDLPGHGHSDDSRDTTPTVDDLAADVEHAIRTLAPNARAVVGMSLGGSTALAIASRSPELVRRLVLVDVTPGTSRGRATTITDFVNGPESFATFDEILDRTIAYNPGRSASSLRRGILHNAIQRDDGRWVWRHARSGKKSTGRNVDPSYLWDVISTLKMPVMLVRGMLPQSLVNDADEAELLRRLPSARVEHVTGAGHSVQGDKPVELAQLIADFVY